jgi:putative ABC transport system substrate-binding protein
MVCFLTATFGPIWETTGPVIREAAQQAGLTVAPALLGRIDQAAYEEAFDAMDRDRAEGFVLADGAEHFTNRVLIVQLAARHRLPAIYPAREFVEVGGLLAYGVDNADVWRRIADMTDQVLRGAKPGDIPFYQQTKFELVLNRTTARSLGLDFRASLLAVADEVIE